MGLFDRLTFEDGLDVTFPDIGADPFEVTWQTKSIARHQPMLENYKISSEGRLFKEEIEYEHVPEEEGPEHDGETSVVERVHRSRKKIHQGWADTEYHGSFEFHRTIDGEYVSLKANFTDGHLVELTRND